VPRTSSGKLQRAACRAAFERGELRRAQTHTLQGDVLAEPSAAERRRTLRLLLVEQVERVLRVSSGTVDTTVPFQQLGLDSLMTAELRERLEVALGARLSPTMFFAHPTTDRLIDQLVDQMVPMPPPPVAAPDDEPALSTEHEDDLARLDEDEIAAVLVQEIASLERVVER